MTEYTPAQTGIFKKRGQKPHDTSPLNSTLNKQHACLRMECNCRPDGVIAKLIFASNYVDKRDIALLFEALRVPPIFKCSNRNNLRWNRRPLYRATVVCISMPLFRHDANLCAIGARAQYDQQPGDRLDI